MKPVMAKLYDRSHEVHRELWAIGREEVAEKTIIKGEEFNHKEWLEAERKAINEQRWAMETTTNVRGEFAGFERGDA